MSQKLLPVVAAVPNYNMADNLKRLLPQLLAQGYDNVFVLDDKSTDSSVAVARSFGRKVAVVEGGKNIGSGGNRNRILDALDYEAVIHFIDADVELLTNDIPAKARQLMAKMHTGFVGGLVLEKNGRQSIWNYGPRFSLYADLTAIVQLLFGNMQAPHPLWRQIVRTLTIRARAEWPDPATTPKSRPVFWCVEANFFVLRSTFEHTGGFDLTMREHDIFEPALQAYRLGLVSYFDPSVTVRHLRINVRGKGRTRTIQKASRYLIRKYGFKAWLLPDEQFKPRYNQ